MDRNRKQAHVAERRRAQRDPLEAAILLKLETLTLSGMNDNISSAGLLFFTDEPIRVTVEVSTPGGTETFSGRLVRAQRMGETSTGIAVEFDAKT
jgi:hypothetical protein